ncbi:MFS transporter [Gluconacetobacter asukensis]|uniref:MFS transporter n=2 Tax=Gluconacetobacter asukensis TaxID=1017181 RepID=A0A7W4J3N1_9PROT|nr:MFS transporter [Gluconacetobacter asukensis]
MQDTLSALPSASTYNLRQAILQPVLAVGTGTGSMGLALSALPLVLHDAWSLPLATIGWTMGTQSVATLLSRLYAGRLSDRMGGGRALTLGLGAAALSGGCYLTALAPLWPQSIALALVLLGRLFMGLSEGLMVTGGGAWIIGAVPADRVGAGMSWFGLAMFAGLAAGTTAGIIIDQAAGFGAVAILTSTLPIVGMILSGWPRRPGEHSVAQGAVPWRQLFRTVLPAGLLLALSSIGFAVISSFLVLAFGQKNWGHGGYALAAFCVGHVVARFAGGHRIDRHAVRVSGSMMLAMETMGFVMLWLAPNPIVAMVGALISGAGFSLIYPVLAIPFARVVVPAFIGSAMGLYDIFFDVALGAGSIAGGMLTRNFPVQAVFLMAALSSGAALIMLASTSRHSWMKMKWDGEK